MLDFKELTPSNFICSLDLVSLYPSQKEKDAFNIRWNEFYDSDESNKYIFTRKDNLITYPHKSWVPTKSNKKPSLLILAGNPAPHSVWKDIYYAYEGKGTEHRFWKVLRELGFIDLIGNDADIKNKFLNLDYISDFRIGIEVIFTFPSTASKPKWSGVMGLERLFGKKYLSKILEIEKMRLHKIIDKFFQNSEGIIIAMQKDAYNAVSVNNYNLGKAVAGELVSDYKGFKVWGTPPTRWMHTQKMRSVLTKIKNS